VYCDEHQSTVLISLGVFLQGTYVLFTVDSFGFPFLLRDTAQLPGIKNVCVEGIPHKSLGDSLPARLFTSHHPLYVMFGNFFFFFFSSTHSLRDQGTSKETQDQLNNLQDDQIINFYQSSLQS
jgi:hypothetical protein